MATILGLDIGPHVVRGVLLKTQLRKTEVLGYASAIVPDRVEPPAALPVPEDMPIGGASSAGDPSQRSTAPDEHVTVGADPGATGAGPTDPAAAAVSGTGPTDPVAPAVTVDPIEAAAMRVDPHARVREALRQLFAALPVPPDRVITELSGDEVSIRPVSFPVKAAKRLDDLLPFELEGKVPFELEESVIDHQPIATVNGELKLLAAVAPKARIQAHLDAMRGLGVDPREIAVGAVALDGLVPLLPALATPGPHCLIDIHAEGTDVCVLKGEACHFARTLSVGIADLDAGRTPLLEREIKQTLAAWRMEGGAQPATFYLCGAMATREGIDAWMSRVVGAPVEILALPPAPGAPDYDRPAFARAAALAGRTLGRGKRLDARQGEFAAAQTATALRQHLPLLATSAAVVVAAFLFSSYARYSVLEARHQQLEDELARVTEEFFGTEARDPSQATALLARGARGNDPMPRFDAYHALAAISESIPQSVTHDVRQLQVDLGDGEETGRFSLRGTVDSVSDTEAIVRALEGHRVIRREGNTETRLACFHEIDLGNTTATADERRSYRLEGEIHCQAEGASSDDDDDGNTRRRRSSGGRN